VQDLATNKRTKRLCGSRLRDPRSIWSDADASPYIEKVERQLKGFHKRLITFRDKSASELSLESIAQFFDNQKTFGFDAEKVPKDLLRIVVDIVSGILGEFSLTEYTEQCAFGKRAAVLLPRRKAYLDNRVRSLNGTNEQIQWFQEIRARDIHLMRATRKALKSHHFEVIDALKITTVPKSFKAARVIAPDSVIGGFLSRGLGNYIRQRLEASTHINLSLQQDRHKEWAKQASVTGNLSTLDMSKASDSFVWKHMELLVPKSWHPILKGVRLGKAQVSDVEKRDLTSYMLMGSGHTFPLQTLLFYAICEGTRRLCRRRGSVSVYGDDIIVPTSIAQECMFALSLFGFTINDDKSFFDKPDLLHPSRTFFRESCGGDFKGGVDVRPFMPEDTYRKVSKMEYIATIHKIHNGLLRRWTIFEIERTMIFLHRHLYKVSRRLNVVPLHETDEAGLHDNWALSYLGTELTYPVLDKLGHTTYFALRKKVRRRKQHDLYPYYWYRLWLDRRDPERLDLKRFWSKIRIRKAYFPQHGPYEDEEPLELGSPEPSRDPSNAYRWTKHS
jgi:hypothetical protein